MKTLVNSGISTAASVPQLMIVASCHHSVRDRFGGDARHWQMSLISSQLITYDVVMHRIDAIQISRVSGASKLNSFRPAILRFGDRLVDEVRHAGHEVHQEPHGEDPDDQLGLDVDAR